MVNSFLKNWAKRLYYILILSIIANPLMASTTSSLPFVSKMNTLKDAIVGPFLLATATIMVSITAFALAFGEWTDGMRKLINIVFWLSIAFLASSFITSMFGTGAIF